MAPTPRSEPPASPPLRILVVEDGPINREIIGELLTGAGFSVTLAADGRSALAAIRETAFDVVLMDLQMPGMDGYETVRRIRRRGDAGHDIPVIAMTAHLMEADRLECLNAGMDGFIPKPLTLNRFREALARCAGDRPASENEAPLPVVLGRLYRLVCDHNLRSEEMLADLSAAAASAGLTIPLDDLAAGLARFDFPDARRELEKIARAARISLSEEP